MRINIMDPALYRVGGHHCDINLRVARQLAEDGHTIRTYVSKNAQPLVMSAFSAVGPVFPIFRAHPYVNPASVDHTLGEYITYHEQSEMVAGDLREVEQADLWLWPTIFASQLNGCAISGVKTAVVGCVHHGVASDAWPNGAMWWRHAFLHSRKAGLKLTIGAIEPELRIGYLPLTTDRRFAVFPIPHDGRPIAEKKENLKTIGFFGSQRPEKGLALVVALAELLVKKGFSVVLQDSGEGIQHWPAGAMRLGFQPELSAEMAKCDLIILPYSPSRYRSKGSGIAWESAATGVPVVAPFNTAVWRMLERAGMGELFVNNSVADIYEAVVKAGQRYEELAENAFLESRAWPRSNGVKKFSDFVIHSANSSPVAQG